MKRSYFVTAMLLFTMIFGATNALAASNLEEGIGQLAQQISKSMQEKQKQKIAIIDFSDLNGNVTSLGQFMAEELTTQLFMVAPGKFEVVERRQLLKLEEELTLGQTGFIEEKSIKKMGQVLGVDAIVTGSMTDLGNTVKINARLIGVESAKVFAVAATDIPKTGMVADLIAKQIEKKPGAIPTTLANSAAAKQETKAEIKKESGSVWEDGAIRVTVESLKKSGKAVNANILFENISDKNIKLDYYYSTAHLLDEDGGRWNWKSDSAEMHNGRDILAGKKIRAKITFEAKDSNNGRVFDLFLLPRSGYSDFYKYSLSIQNIKSE